MKSKIKFILSMIIFGTIGLFVRYIDMPSSAIALVRGLIGSVFLVMVIFLLKQKVSWTKVKENALLLIISSILLGANWVFLFQAYKNTSIANATLSYYFAPVIVMLLSPLIMKEKLSIKKILCVGVAVLGMFFIVGNGSSESSVGNNLLGIIYGLMAATCYATLVFVNKFLKGLGGLEIAFIQLFIAAVVLFPYVVVSEGVSVFVISGGSLLLLIILGVLHTGVGFFLFFSGMQGIKAQSMATLSYLDPITSLFLSIVILQEPITSLQAVGGILLLGATFLGEKGSTVSEN